MKAERIFIWSMLLTWIAVLAFGIRLALAVEPGEDLPKSEPVSSTGFVCKFDKGFQVMAIVVSYKDGSIVRFDLNDMHGMTWAQATTYSDSVKDSSVYVVPCKTSWDKKASKHESV